ncbi:autotransporter-associated beta strand repeat-containing protein [Luteolibacter sp. GHJ8]|uniref:Autotransporter-associated beta strand repeat-containing protein n=1 Tax=Luteolibacter rhizosphaerae TaxID=2989719 RepID=A0ABT3G0P4_9BACT|nr:autotransporter-associated beta strand repeat-containing protein [Luteolibacter rhizosphaerae]MCW1913164.1 autotransporter-associated beta strand repeat-containing protein [Luteolibacter rhizosphaerae]
MKNQPTRTPITRASLTAAATYNSRWFATLVAGTTVLGSSSFAVDNLWNGSVSNDWNTAANWSLGRVPNIANGQPTGDNFDDATIQTLTNFPVLTASPVVHPRDIKVGNANGTTGRVDHRAGTARTGSGNWMFVGTAGGNGTYNLADTSGTGGASTGFAQGTGSLNVGGPTGSGARLYVGGDDGGGDGGTGLLNVNTSGTLSATNDIIVGSQAGTGVMNLDNGTVNSGNAGAGAWVYIGVNTGNGTLNMNGGSITVNGRFYTARNNATGLVNFNQGSISTNGHFIVAENENDTFVNPNNGTFNHNAGTVNVGGGGEMWVGQRTGSVGIYNFSSGTINVNSWVAIGRDGGTGTFNMSGGTFTKGGAADQRFIVGATGPGTMTQGAGLVDITSSQMWVGENNAGTYTLNGGEVRTPNDLTVAQNGSATGILNLNGGTLRTSKIVGGGGNATVRFNGTQIFGTSNQPNFLAGSDVAEIQAGGLLVNSNGFNLTAPQALSGTGNVTKSGTGTLALVGASTFTGTSTVSAGKLVLGTRDPLAAAAGAVTVANNAAFGVTLSGIEQSLTIPSAGFGTGTTLDINIGNNFPPQTGFAPLKVTGAINLAANLPINLTHDFPETGTYELIQYGSKTGTGNFVIGTLPLGMAATLDTATPGVVKLVVTSVALPRWEAGVSNDWNTTEVNWVNTLTSTGTTFTNGNPALFDDNAQGAEFNNGAVDLNVTVSPGLTTFNNSLYDYTLAGSGSISGAGGLTKQGTANTTISTTNNYTGQTRLEGGTVTVNTLTNGGVAGPLGAASSASSNLVIAGGGLVYTGASTTIDRGWSYDSPLDNALGSINIANNLTVTGQLIAPNQGKLQKLGAGTLTLSFPGANVLGKGAGTPASLRVDEGSLVLEGGGTQTNSVTGEVWVGSNGLTGATATLNSTSLTASSWMVVSRGNGTTGLVSSLTANNSTITTQGLATANLSGVVGHSAIGNITLNNSTINTGDINIGEGAGGTSTVTLNGNSQLNTTNRVFLGNENGANGTLIVKDTASFNRTGGWLSIGGNGTGTITVQNSGVLNNTAGDFNISDVDNSNGTLNVQDSAVVNAGTFFVGKGVNTIGNFNISGGTLNGGTTLVAQNATSNGTITQTGGTVNIGNNDVVFIGENGTGTWNQSAGVVNTTGWTVVGRYQGANGVLNITGGTFNQNQTDRRVIVGEDGTGTLSVSGSGALNVNGDLLVIGNGGNGNGTVNLDGGTITTKRVQKGSGGISAFNFDGGLLKAGAGAQAVFFTGIDTATVEDGGANIDSNGQTIEITSSLMTDGNGGGLTKLGAGTLYLSGFNSYTGLTTVSAGALGGAGFIDGSVQVATGASIAPGNPTGILEVDGNVNFATGSNFAVTINNANPTPAGELDVNGTLNLANANLTLTGTPTLPVYIIASYGTLSGGFASTPTLPAGYTLQTNYLGNNQIAIVRPASPFENWVDDFFPFETDPAVIGADADPDGDGDTNVQEFMLGGVPNDGSNGAKVYKLVADSSDGGTANELLLTIAVLNGTPVFAGSPSPSAATQGYTYTAQGSTNLSAFTTQVNVVTPVTTGLPAAPSGYTYRTFSLNGSDGLPSRGFLRVNVTPTP